MSNLNVAGKVFSLSRIKYWLLYCTRLINRSDIFSPLRIYTYYSSYCLAPLRLSSHKLVLMFHMHRYGLCVFLIYAFYVLLSLELFVLSNDVIFAFYFLVSCRLNLNAQNYYIYFIKNGYVYNKSCCKIGYVRVNSLRSSP